MVESNWTEPWLFAIYSLIKPVAGAFILVLMYLVLLIVQGGAQAANAQLRFDYIYIGNALFIFLGNVLWGTFRVVESDREWYETIRYIYISPMSYYVYIVGRAAATVVVAGFAVATTLLFGVLFLNVTLAFSWLDIPVLIFGMVLGLLCVMAIGVCLAGLALLMAHHSGIAAEGVSGVFYLFCGVIFPLSVLPIWAQNVGKSIPLTYWFDYIRRLVMPADHIAVVNTGLVGYSTTAIFLLLLVSTLLFFFLSVLIFRYSEYVAKRQGRIDLTTAY